MTVIKWTSNPSKKISWLLIWGKNWILCPYITDSSLTVYSTYKKFPIQEAPLFLFKLVFLQLILAWMPLNASCCGKDREKELTRSGAPYLHSTPPRGRRSGFPSWILMLHHPLQASSASHSLDLPESGAGEGRQRQYLITNKICRIRKEKAPSSSQEASVMRLVELKRGSTGQRSLGVCLPFPFPSFLSVIIIETLMWARHYSG